MFIDGIVQPGEPIASRNEMLRAQRPRVEGNFSGTFVIPRTQAVFQDPKTARVLFGLAKFLLALTISFSIIYALMNWPAVIANLKYMAGGGQRPQNTKVVAVLPTSPVQTAAPTPTDDGVKVADNELYIPKIDIRAPIVYMDSIEEQAIMEKLKNGVGHFPGTAYPGENGNVFILGHSSYYWWEEGNFKEVFALLDRLEIGDKIYIGYKGKKYVYQVTETKIVPPTDVSVLAQTASPQLTLMTCNPVGTAINRLIIIAKQVAPAPSENSSPKRPMLPQTIKSLPGVDKSP
jgi:LPXTG-site transpeptidase (sortase) family protein